MSPGAGSRGRSRSAGGVTRIWGSSAANVAPLPAFVLEVVFGVWALVAGLGQGSPMVTATGAILVVVGSVLVVVLLRTAVFPLTLADGYLRIPKVFGRTDVPLSSLAGVGLVYSVPTGAPGNAGWALTVWDRDRGIRLRRWRAASSLDPDAATRSGRPTADWTAPFDDEDLAYLAASGAGRVARQIYDAAVRVQGYNGPLRTRARQRAIVYDPDAMVSTVAWWSPDGAMGRAAGIPGPGPVGVAAASGAPWFPAGPAGVPVVPGPPAGVVWPEDPSVRRPAPVPTASPEVRRARRRSRRYSLASGLVIITAVLPVVVLLQQYGHLPTGELCQPVLGPPSVHPSAACDAWRHHQLTVFLPIASMLLVVFVVIVVLQVRSVQEVRRLSGQGRAVRPGVR